MKKREARTRTNLRIPSSPQGRTSKNKQMLPVIEGFDDPKCHGKDLGPEMSMSYQCIPILCPRIHISNSVGMMGSWLRGFVS